MRRFVFTLLTLLLSLPGSEMASVNTGPTGGQPEPDHPIIRLLQSLPRQEVAVTELLSPDLAPPDGFLGFQLSDGNEMWILGSPSKPEGVAFLDPTGALVLSQRVTPDSETVVFPTLDSVEVARRGNGFRVTYRLNRTIPASRVVVDFDEHGQGTIDLAESALHGEENLRYGQPEPYRNLWSRTASTAASPLGKSNGCEPGGDWRTACENRVRALREAQKALCGILDLVNANIHQFLTELVCLPAQNYFESLEQGLEGDKFRFAKSIEMDVKILCELGLRTLEDGIKLGELLAIDGPLLPVVAACEIIDWATSLASYFAEHDIDPDIVEGICEKLCSIGIGPPKGPRKPQPVPGPIPTSPPPAVQAPAPVPPLPSFPGAPLSTPVLAVPPMPAPIPCTRICPEGTLLEASTCSCAPADDDGTACRDGGQDPLTGKCVPEDDCEDTSSRCPTGQGWYAADGPPKCHTCAGLATEFCAVTQDFLVKVRLHQESAADCPDDYGCRSHVFKEFSGAQDTFNAAIRTLGKATQCARCSTNAWIAAIRSCLSGLAAGGRTANPGNGN